MPVKSTENLFMLSPTNVTSVRFMTESVHFTRRSDVTADLSSNTTIVAKPYSTRGGFLTRARMHIRKTGASSISNVVSQILHLHDFLFESVCVFVGPSQVTSTFQHCTTSVRTHAWFLIICPHITSTYSRLPHSLRVSTKPAAKTMTHVVTYSDETIINHPYITQS